MDDTYKEYLFTFKNIHPATQSTFSFNVSIDGGSNYNVAKTTSAFNAATSYDLAQGTGFQILDQDSLATDNDASLSGFLRLFDPSSTTFVKHFMSENSNLSSSGVFCNHTYVAGYCNTTSAVDAVQFKMGSDEIDAGDICLYGIK